MKKIKHNHKGTKLIKLSLFASMMFAPILAVLFKCAYVTFNKNAYQSYSSQNLYEETNVTNYNNGNEYFINIKTNDLLSSTITIVLDDNIKDLMSTNLTSNTLDLVQTNCTRVLFINNSTNNMYISFRDNANSTITNINLKSDGVSFTFTSSEYLGPISELTSYMKERIYNANSYLDNAFEYSINQLEESNLFNWTKTAALYTPTQAMTSGMGIQTDSIAMIITYWMYITAIYIVIDIVVELFTYITHTITSRLETD